MPITLRVNTAQSGLDIPETLKSSALSNVELDSNFQVINTTIFTKAPKQSPTLTGTISLEGNITRSGNANIQTEVGFEPTSAAIINTRTDPSDATTGTTSSLAFTRHAGETTYQQSKLTKQGGAFFSGNDLGAPDKPFANLYVGDIFTGPGSIQMGSGEAGEPQTVISAEPSTGGIVLPDNTAIGEAVNVIPPNLASTILDRGFAARGTQKTLSHTFELEGLDIGSAPAAVQLNSNGKVQSLQDAKRFVGFVTSLATAGSFVTVIISGAATGFSGLQAGDEYFIDPNGTLSTTNSATNTKAGVGLSATSLFIYSSTTVDTYVQNLKKIELTDISVTSNSAGVSALTYNNTTGSFTFTPTDLTAKADIASPTFTGTPSAPTAAAATNTTQVATTEFVQAAVSDLIDSAPGTLDTLNEIAAAIANDGSFATTINNSIATKAPLASPALTGSPTAPTVSSSDDSTAIATTAFVNSVFSGTAQLNSPAMTGIPTAPTAAASVNNTQIATTAYVTTAVAQGGGASNLDGGLANTTRTLATHHFDGGNA